MLFPLNDLGDMVSSKIAQATNKKVFVFFERLSLSLIPSPGLAVEDVTIEGQSIPKIEARAASFSPSVLDLLKLKAGGHLNIQGLFGSDFSSSFTLDQPDAETGETAHDIAFEIEGLNLKEIAPLLPVPMTVKGTINGEGEFIIDQSFTTQPEGSFEIASGNSVLFESLSIPQASLVFSDMEFSKILIKGKISEGEIKLDEFVLGSPNNDLFVQAKGGIGVEFAAGRGRGAGVRPLVRRFNLMVKLTRSNRLQQKDAFIASSLDLLFDNSKAKIIPSGTGKSYQFRVQGVGLRQTRLSPLPSF